MLLDSLVEGVALKTIGDGRFPQAGCPILSIYLSFVGEKKKEWQNSESGGRQSLKWLHLLPNRSAEVWVLCSAVHVSLTVHDVKSLLHLCF